VSHKKGCGDVIGVPRPVLSLLAASGSALISSVCSYLSGTNSLELGEHPGSGSRFDSFRASLTQSDGLA
jgi:hypothetical protein